MKYFPCDWSHAYFDETDALRWKQIASWNGFVRIGHSKHSLGIFNFTQYEKILVMEKLKAGKKKAISSENGKKFGFEGSMIYLGENYD